MQQDINRGEQSDDGLFLHLEVADKRTSDGNNPFHPAGISHLLLQCRLWPPHHPGQYAVNMIIIPSMP